MEHKRRRDRLVQSRLPLFRLRLSAFPLFGASRSLKFLYPAPSHACAERRPSRRTVGRERRSPTPSSIGCCRPSAAGLPDTRPSIERSAPTAVWRWHPPAPCLSSSYFVRSTDEAERLQVDKWKRRAFGRGADPDTEQWEQPVNPVDHSEFWEPRSGLDLWSSSPAIAPAVAPVPTQGRGSPRWMLRTRRRAWHELIAWKIWIEDLVSS